MSRWIPIMLAMLAFAEPAAAADARPDRWSFVYAAYAAGLLLVVGHAAATLVRLLRAEAAGGKP